MIIIKVNKEYKQKTFNKITRFYQKRKIKKNNMADLN